MNDCDLIKEIINGSHIAFDALMGRYYIPMFVLASQILHNDPATEDVVQDVFVDLWENKNKLRQVRSAGNYIYTMTRNKCVNVIRSSGKLKTYRDYFSENENDTTTDYDAIELMRQLWDAVETLPPRTGQVIKLSMEGLRQEEIAEKMAIALPTVKMLKAHGIKKLKEMLGESSCLVIVLLMLLEAL